MDPDVKAHLEKLEDARSEYRCLVASLQTVCDHPQLLHAKWRASRSRLFPGLDQTRLCLRCGLEERSTAWTDGGGFKHLKGEFTKEVSHEELWAARFPHLPKENIR